jgi:hypothetical protein
VQVLSGQAPLVGGLSVAGLSLSDVAAVADAMVWVPLLVLAADSFTAVLQPGADSLRCAFAVRGAV